MGDDLLPRLWENNRIGETLDDEDSTKFEHARRLVWGLVFQGWDTGETLRKPPRNAPLRSMVHVKVLIGHLIHDTPISAQIASAASPATDSSAVKENRQVAAEVYTRPAPHWESDQIEFPKYNERGRPFVPHKQPWAASGSREPFVRT